MHFNIVVSMGMFIINNINIKKTLKKKLKKIVRKSVFKRKIYSENILVKNRLAIIVNI